MFVVLNTVAEVSTDDDADGFESVCAERCLAEAKASSLECSFSGSTSASPVGPFPP